MDAPIWLDLGDKFASLIGAVSGVLGLAFAVYGQRQSGVESEPDPAKAWHGWLRVAAFLGAFPLLILIVRGAGVVPDGWQRASSLVAFVASTLACVAAFMAWVSYRRQAMPLPGAVRALLGEQFQDARRHQYEYFIGDAPPIPEIYVEQKTETVLPAAAGAAPVQLLTVHQMVLGHRNTVVVAEPGIGKSTMVALILREQCRWWLDARRIDDPARSPFGSVVPVLVPAELLAERGLTDAMAAHCERVTGRLVPARLFERPPSHADAWLVLVDGLDQVLSSRLRARVLARLGDAMAAGSDHLRFVITTRPLLGELGNLSGERITRFSLRRFEQQDLTAFAERWAAHRERTHLSHLDVPPVTVERFLAAVAAARLSAMARVPLIATITILIMETDQAQALPTSRSGLYERFIQHLLHSRNTDPAQQRALSAEFTRHGERGARAWEWLSGNLRGLLEGTADIFLSEAGTQVTASAIRWVTDHAPPGLFTDLPGWDASLRTLLTSTSLIVPRTGGLQFAHPSFAEYLAAGPRARDFDRTTWLADARSPDGRNLALFTLARSTHSPDPLVTLLMERGGTDACIAGEIIADGIPVSDFLRANVITRLFDQLTHDDRSAPEALGVLINLTTHPSVTARLRDLIGDPDCPAWVRAFTADALCAITPEGTDLLRAVLADTDDTGVQRWILERLAARDQASLDEHQMLSAFAPADVQDITSTSAMAALWYRQIVEDSGADPGRRLRALLALADGGYGESLDGLEGILTLQGLTPQARLDATRAIVQTGLPGALRTLRHIIAREGLDLEIRVPVLAALASSGDTEARQQLDIMAEVGGEEFTVRFPALALWSQETGMRSTEQDADNTPRVWGRIPPRNLYFSGRAQHLTDLRQQFQSGNTTQTLHGMGGIGKTQLAIEYAYRFRADYDVVWWIPADQPLLLRAALAELAPHLGLPPTHAPADATAAASVLARLQQGDPYRRWLLIFDNADQPEDIYDALPHGPGHVLITSRKHRWNDATHMMEVDVFDREESIEFLRLRMPSLDEQVADGLADELADLPLSLENAAATLAQSGQPGQEYLLELQSRAGELLQSETPTPYPISVMASLATTLHQVEQEDDQAVELLRLCSFFGPEPIPFDALSADGTGTHSAFSDPLRLLRTVDLLHRYGLALLNRSERTIQVGRLVLALIKEGLDDEEHERLEHEVHLMIAATAPAHPEEPLAQRRYHQLTGHLLPTRLERCPDPAVRACTLRFARYFLTSGDTRACTDLLQDVLEWWSTGLPDTDPHLQQTHLLNATALRLSGRHHQALQASERSFQAARGFAVGRKLAAEVALGTDLRITGAFAAALDLDHATFISGQERPDDEQTMLAGYRLALDHELLGDHTTAYSLYTKVYTACSRRDTYRSHTLTALALTGAARTRHHTGDLTASHLLAADARNLIRRPDGVSGSAATAVLCDYTASVRRISFPAPDSPFLAAAIRELTAHADIAPSGHLDSLLIALSLGTALRASDRLDQAQDHSTIAADDCAQLLGDDHPYTHAARGSLAVIRRLQGDAEQALTLNTAALEGLTVTLGSHHHHTLACATNLASDYAALGDLDAAAQLGATTLDTLRTYGGEHHPVTRICQNNLANDLHRLGRTEAPEHHSAGRLTADIDLSPLYAEHSCETVEDAC